MGRTPRPLERMERLPRVETSRFTVPWAPSVNHSWRVNKTDGRARVHISEEYRKFKAAVTARALAGEIPRVKESERYAVKLICRPPNGRKYDLDNRIKATLDALTTVGIWADDSLVVKIYAEKGAPDKEGFIQCEVTALAPERG